MKAGLLHWLCVVLFWLTASPALACLGPESESYVLQSAKPATIPTGAVVLMVDVNPQDFAKEDSIYSGIIAKVRSPEGYGRKVLIAASSWTSCTWWRAVDRPWFKGEADGPYYVAGYTYISPKGLLGIDPVEYGSKGKLRAPRKRFSTAQAYFAQIVENVRSYRRMKQLNP
jgi:hypothetical protein